MQRTYKSKKETGGGLDPRDMILALDEKTSVFDAFSIQNIKQTKRELSCMGATNPYSSAANKVRKRKYVKRIVKDIETKPRESMSKSTYLTPDKSIHVKKEGDLFDMLLNSSGTKPIDNVKDCIFDKITKSKEKRMYTRKKITKAQIKKYNYSSSETSDPEKENKSVDLVQNKTDIGKHELIVEKHEISMTYQDESINQMVNNLSLINKFKDNSPKNRLTLTVPLAPNQNSPLCSTPFSKKYRGKSIYKFSPIALGKLDETGLNFEENKETSIDLDHNKPEVLDDCERCASPIIHTSKDNVSSIDLDHNKLEVLDDCEKFASPIIHTSKDNVSSNSNKSKNTSDPNTSRNDSMTKTNPGDCSTQKSNDITTYEDSSENTQFLGFSNATICSTTEHLFLSSKLGIRKEMLCAESPRKSIVLPSTSIKIFKEKKSQEPIRLSSSREINDSDIKIMSDSAIRYGVEQELFLGFSSINVRQSEAGNENLNVTDNSVVEITMLENENPQEINKTETNDSEVDHSKQDISSDDGESSQSDKESLYDTCTSLQSCDTSSDSSHHALNEMKQPIVVVEKLSDSQLPNYNKCYEQSSSDNLSSGENNSDNSESETSCDAKESSENSMHENSDENEENSEVEADSTLDSSQGASNSTIMEYNKNKYIRELNKTAETNEETDSQSNGEEEKHVSFVTTRRRNDVVNDSLLFVLDDSHNSSSNSEYDKTVVTNENIEDSVPDSSDILKRKDIVIPKDTSVISKDDRLSITVRNTRASHSSPRQSVSRDMKTCSEMNPPIILQPGKKWERSLSIYRRLTLMNDESLLDEKEMAKKGRKYRESIIGAIELQNISGPLHNESFTNYRNSTLHRQHRSTIRILKDIDSSRLSLQSSGVYEDLSGFLNEDCDDTLVELSRLSIADPENVTVLEKVHNPPERITSARDYVLRRCNQTEPILFDECYPDSLLKNCHKIGEGVYGEVFLWRARDGPRVMKVVPVDGTTVVNGEQQKDFQEIISEIVIAMELSALRTPIAEIENLINEGKDIDSLDLHAIENATDVFNEVLAVRCVYGSYPNRLLDLWDLYDETKGSENDNPAALPPQQNYLVLELANAGQDLESYQFNNAEQAYGLFLQLAYGLAVAEEAFQFEHRDLHWGNVLISPTEQKHATFILRGRRYSVLRRGVCLSVIDYSLSRARLGGAGAGGVALYCDLAADGALFGAAGDYQFDIYRLMRERLGNDWKNFEPYTNILWLHYTVDKMITALRYKRTNTKVHKLYIAKLRAIKDRLLDYGSCVQFVLTDNEL